jgi:NADH-quinone oxidoreductase subunit N
VVKAMFINKNDTPIAKIESDNYGRFALLICVIGIFAIGFFGQLFEYINNLSFGI